MFDLRKKIVTHYQERVKTAEIPNELRRALKTEERIPLFVDNLTRELSKVRNLREDQLRDSVYSMTDVFIAAVKAKAEQRNLSELEVARINFAYAAKRAMVMQAERVAQEEAKRIDRARRALGEKV